MLNEPELAHLRVLITRPKHQGQALATQLSRLGAICFLYPTLETEPLTFDQTIPSQLAKQDYLIFTSVNAVLAIQSILQQLQNRNQLPELIAVGSVTAQSLMDLRLPKPVYPIDHFSSEGVLALDCLQSCQDQYIGIVSGIGGRTLLPDQLHDRGAHVQKFAVYRRIPAQKPTIEALITWQNPGIDVVISTSVDGLTQLVTNFEKISLQAKNWLLSQQLLIMSDRLMPTVKKAAFSKAPLIANIQSDEGIIHTLMTFWDQQRKQ